MQVEVLQSSYSRGSVRDLARHVLPQGSVWKMTDFIPDLLGAPLQKRGGWSIVDTLTGKTSCPAVAWAPFSGGDQRIAIANDRTLFANGVSKGALADTPISAPVFFDSLLILPGSTVYKYDGTNAPAALSGAPANGLYADTYKSRLVLGVGNDLHFSAPGNPQSWDALSTIGMTDPITGVAALRNMIAVFAKGRSERIRGSIPPSSTSDGDMVREPMFNEGCLDARSIAVDGDKVIWANANGVHISDGAAIDNLISLGGLQQYWTTLMRQYTTSWTLAGGLYGGYYVIAIMNGSTFVDALMCKTATKTWTFLSNFPVKMFARAYASAPELYMGLSSTNKTAAFSSVLAPSSSNAHDGDGTAVQPVLEGPFYRGSPGLKRWHTFFIGVDLDASAGTYLTVEYTEFPEDGVYTLVTNDDGSTFEMAPTSGYERTKVETNLPAEGVGLRISQVGASNTTMLFDIEAVVRSLEGRYRGQ